MRKLLVFVVRVYQAVISPALPFNHCRFYPSCSEYAAEAIERYGGFKGAVLAIRRVLRCQPFHTHSGFDPVP